jgi:hypothetical protein
VYICTISPPEGHSADSSCVIRVCMMLVSDAGFCSCVRVSERTCLGKLKHASVDLRPAAYDVHSQNFACTLFEAQFVDKLTDADGSPSNIQDLLDKVKRARGEGGREDNESGR